jgi:transposase-like protein
VIYTDSFKAKMVQRLSVPNAISAIRLSKEVGVSQSQLSRWLLQARTVAPMIKDRPSDRVVHASSEARSASSVNTEVTVPAGAIAAEAATRTRRDVLRTSPSSTLPNCSAAHAVGSIMRPTERFDAAMESIICTMQQSDRRRPVAPS